MATRTHVGFISLGCPKNLVDTERMMDLLSKEGAVITGDVSLADIVVINTCGFLEPAKNESMDTIAEYAALKKQGDLKGLVVTGCMTERYLKLMSDKYPEVDSFLQTREFSRITEVVQKICSKEGGDARKRLELEGEIVQLAGHSEITDFVTRSPGKRSYAYVKISEGCNRTCSFCIIPKLRGKLHSRSIDGILDEIKQLVGFGTKEVVLIAQDLTSYGRDRHDGARLLELLQGIEEIEGLHWYRLMYNYPRFFTKDLIEFLSASKKFARYLDIPFQHISDSVLKKMNRPESSKEIKQLISDLRSKIDGLSLRTTLMVGFPGETDEDFEELLNFIEETKFENMGAFTYWREPGTPSHDLENQVEADLKAERYHELMSLQKKVQKSILKSKVNEVLDVIIDGISEKTKRGVVYSGRHAGQAPDVDGITYVLSEAPLEIGSLYKVQISKILGDYDLLGMRLQENLKSVGT